MAAGVAKPPFYQTLEHFMDEGAWSAARKWEILRAEMREGGGPLPCDDKGLLNEGEETVGVARQGSGTLGRIGKRQVAVTAGLWTGVRA
jgi:SRSO17 transposase